MYHKSRKNKLIFKKKRKNTLKKKTNQSIIMPLKDEYEQVLDAIMLFNYNTDAEQVFKTEQEKQKHLVLSTKVLRDSVDKYIQSRSNQF